MVCHFDFEAFNQSSSLGRPFSHLPVPSHPVTACNTQQNPRHRRDAGKPGTEDDAPEKSGRKGWEQDGEQGDMQETLESRVQETLEMPERVSFVPYLVGRHLQETLESRETPKSLFCTLAELSRNHGKDRLTWFCSLTTLLKSWFFW